MWKWIFLSQKLSLLMYIIHTIKSSKCQTRDWFDLKCCFSIFLCKTICVFQQLTHVEVSNPFDKYQILFREISKLSLVQQSLHLINVFSKIQNPWQIFKVSLQSEDLIFPLTKNIVQIIHYISIITNMHNKPIHGRGKFLMQLSISTNCQI